MSNDNNDTPAPPAMPEEIVGVYDTEHGFYVTFYGSGDEAKAQALTWDKQSQDRGRFITRLVGGTKFAEQAVAAATEELSGKAGELEAENARLRESCAGVAKENGRLLDEIPRLRSAVEKAATEVESWYEEPSDPEPGTMPRYVSLVAGLRHALSPQPEQGGDAAKGVRCSNPDCPTNAKYHDVEEFYDDSPAAAAERVVEAARKYEQMFPGTDGKDTHPEFIVKQVRRELFEALSDYDRAKGEVG